MISYKDAGVDIDAGIEFVNAIKPHVKATATSLVLGGIGSFSGAIALPSGYKKPAILATTDGVGTKLRLAIDANKLNTVGEDLVAMCVNDLICNFATPLFFLDYYATAKLNVKAAKIVVKSIANGCVKAKCALIGGETAEMPSMYKEGDFDLAGFAVGIAEQDEIDRTKFVQEDDLLVALPSSGLHSNGYSLARKVIKEKGLKFDDELEGEKLIDLLLRPTKIYVQDFLTLKDKIHAIAHITGGGLVENLPRVFPAGLGAKITKSAIKMPKIYDIFDGIVSESELYRTFNTGVGMVLVLPRENLEFVLANSDGYVIGEVVQGNGVELI